MTLNETTDFKVYRRPECNSNAPKHWLRMRKAIADLYRRVEVSQQANERYLNALASLDTSTRLI